MFSILSPSNYGCDWTIRSRKTIPVVNNLFSNRCFRQSAISGVEKSNKVVKEEKMCFHKTSQKKKLRKPFVNDAANIPEVQSEARTRTRGFVNNR